jgi:hypothetical protein
MLDPLASMLWVQAGASPVCTLFVCDRAVLRAYVVYFGIVPGSPPGVPGGGMTFIRPPPGAGFCISGSTFVGGQITPFEVASWSLRFEPPLPTVPPLPVPGAHGARAAGPGWAGAVCAAATPVPSRKTLTEIIANRCICASR